MTSAGAPLRRDGLTWLIYAQFIVFGYFLYGFTPSVTLLQDDEHVSDAVAGLHGTAYAIGVVIVGAIGARILAVTGRNRGFWLFLAVLAAGIGLYASVPVLPLTLIGAGIAGAGGSGVLLTSSATLAEHHGSAGPAAITQANALGAGVGLLAPLVIGASVDLGYGWRPALLLVIPALLVLFAVRRAFGPGLGAAPVATDATHEGGRVRLGRAYWLTWLVVVATVAIEFCMTLWSAQLLRDQAGLSRAAAATGVTAIVAGLAVGRAVSYRLTARRSPDWLLARAFALNAAGFVVFWISRNGVLAFVGLAICGLGMALQYPISVARAIAVAAGTGPDASRRANHASAAISLGTGFAVGIAPFLLGWLADMIGIRYAFLLVPLLITLAGVGLLVAHQQGRPLPQIDGSGDTGLPEG
ncbi:MAG TPA: MFS transporter [Micromonosporaceae bacterium]|jgi:MFS family permease